MKLLSPVPLGRLLELPVAMRHHSPGVVCVSAPPADILTAAAQLVSADADTLLVSCCALLPPGAGDACGAVAVGARPRRHRGAAAGGGSRVVAVSAHCLRSVERCNELLKHAGQDAQLVLLKTTGSKLHSCLARLVSRSFEMNPKNPAAPATEAVGPAVYDDRFVPTRAVTLRVVATTDEIGMEGLPQFGGEQGAVNYKTQDGAETRFWPGMVVRAGLSQWLQRVAGVSPGLPGVIEQISRYGWPIVRFANAVVVLLQLEEAKAGDPRLPLTPANGIVTARELQELPALPPHWQLDVADGVGRRCIQHLLI
jgi:hypothetical protein